MRSDVKLGTRTVSYLRAHSATMDPVRPARTIVWLHAFPLSAEMWQPQLAAVTPGFRAIAPDFPGFGATDPLDDRTPPSLDAYAADVIDLLQSLRLDHVVVGGLSMGGYAALALFRLAPQLFSGLILADTRAGADSEQGLEGRRRLIALAEREGAPAVAADMLPKALGETTRRERADLVERVRGLIAAQPAHAIRTASQAMMARRDSTALLRDVRVPTLVIVGREDTLTPPSEAEKLHAAIPGSVLETIDRAGHLSNLEAPAAFNAAVDAFLTHRV